MVALTYGDARVATPETKTATKTKTAAETAPRRSFFARFLAAMMESRMRQAEREIRLHMRLLPQIRDRQAELPFNTIDTDTPRGGW